ncbi:MAG: dihydropteroate synthase [Gemmataceae bacterium]|nr:dihydropteroate synthase [Gemmataceae bacterium]
MIWRVRGRTLDLSGRALVMGVVNVTPDSFSDGGLHLAPAAAIAHGLELARLGSDLLDIGGESSRPGASPVSLEEELARVLPVVQGLAGATEAVLSVDTVKPEVADRALAAGAHLVNDISALRDPAMAEVVNRHGAGIVLMHMKGDPATMQDDPRYGDVAAEVAAFLEARLQAAAVLGIDGERTAVDPGIGFGKTAQHNLELLARLGDLGRLGRPVVLGVSRKRFLGTIAGKQALERDDASLACASHALAHGWAHVVRTHAAGPMADAVRVHHSIRTRTMPPAE